MINKMKAINKYSKNFNIKNKKTKYNKKFKNNLKCLSKTGMIKIIE